MQMTVSEAAKAYSVNRHTVINWIKKGEVNFIRTIFNGENLGRRKGFVIIIDSVFYERVAAYSCPKEHLVTRNEIVRREVNPKFAGVIDFSILGARQAAIVRYLIEHKKNNIGQAPTMREICVATGISSTSVVRRHLFELCALGYIWFGEENESRCIFLLGEVYIPPQTINDWLVEAEKGE